MQFATTEEKILISQILISKAEIAFATNKAVRLTEFEKSGRSGQNEEKTRMYDLVTAELEDTM